MADSQDANSIITELSYHIIIHRHNFSRADNVFRLLIPKYLQTYNQMKFLLWHGKWLYYCCQVREWVTPLPLQSCLCNQGNWLWQSVILIVMGLLTIIYFRYFIPIGALHLHRIRRIVINLSRVDYPGEDQ